ncbi:MAG: hypothetical protein M3R52_11710 [Acidobacteriota bacterium]|nr:hypothetical protein [Acidobacteriota bacterium]
MTGTIIFDLVMPEDATEQEIKAQAAVEYGNAVDPFGGFTLYCGLPDCRVYIDTVDGLEPAEIGIVDTKTINEDEEEED